MRRPTSRPRARTAISIRPLPLRRGRSRPSTTRRISRTRAWSPWVARRSSRTARWTSGPPLRARKLRSPMQRRWPAFPWKTSKCTACRWAVASLNDLPHAIPNVRIEYAQRNTHVPVGFWRTVGHSQNPFVRESFMDELAGAAGKDPYEYRRALLAKSPKDLGVLEATAKAAGWGKPLPAGAFRGIAQI